jgi:hypothetical protein
MACQTPFFLHPGTCNPSRFISLLSLQPILEFSSQRVRLSFNVTQSQISEQSFLMIWDDLANCYATSSFLDDPELAHDSE